MPCNVFGTVDRCDGMACEHDGNCFSGCCSIFVGDGNSSGEADQKRCMPLVNGDMCPIAIDVVAAPTPEPPIKKLKPAETKSKAEKASFDEDEDDEDEAEYLRDHRVI